MKWLILVSVVAFSLNGWSNGQRDERKERAFRAYNDFLSCIDYGHSQRNVEAKKCGCLADYFNALGDIPPHWESMRAEHQACQRR